MKDAPAFAELVAASHFSFLRGASPPADLVARALALGLSGIGIADRNSVAGVVRAHVAWRQALSRAETQGLALPDFRLLVGARLVFADGTPDIVAYPQHRAGWGRLTRLLTTGNMRATKGSCILRLADLLAFHQGLQLIVLPESTATPQQPHRKPVDHDSHEAPAPALSLVEPAGLAALLARLQALAPGRLWLGAGMAQHGTDQRRLARLAATAAAAGVPLIATNDALYATACRRPLHDILSCIRLGTPIHSAGRALEANAERHLKSPAEMARLFRQQRCAIAETGRFMATIGFDLDQLRYAYPNEPVPDGWEPQPWLEHIVRQAAYARYGAVLSPKVEAMLAEEFRLIRKRCYAPYFLTVHDLVRFARAQSPPILCQGRGSAANSIVCFLLGVTSVDPNEHDLLFSRFVSEERNEPPDIDVDFEHERREEVIQYIYRRYGRHRAGIAATVIHYRPRSAVREVGKALGFSADVTARLVSTVWGSFSRDMPEDRFRESGIDPDTPDIQRLRTLVDQLLEAPFPRHLSQHVGGFVLTEDRLDETVPLVHAAMPDRSFIEWDKDDIDALGLMKVDVLALGMLTAIRRSFDLMRAHDLGDHDLEVDLNADDAQVFDILCRGDSIGVFQVESRAQINMLPRLKPRCLYDLTVQVAIVRPGPIEGEMVHPYLRRRAGIDPVELPSPAPPHDPNELQRLLGKTYGVPIFQEQAMKLAIVAAGFTPAQANRLRRAMATFRHHGRIGDFHQKLIAGMTARGYAADFAERCFRQIEGFGSYGFPESHALSFARLVYVSAWIKCHHPAVFTCALLNSQPMGFYAPAQLVRDAQAHGVPVHAVDVNLSGWDNSLEPQPEGQPAIRLGLRQLDGFRQSWAEALVAARGRGYGSIEELSQRGALPTAAIRLLADADAMGSIGLSRRPALWEARRTQAGQLPLFAAADAAEQGAEPDAALPPMPLAEEVVADYQTLRLSLKAHPLAFLRARYTREGLLAAADIAAARHGATVRTAGVVLIRQRPGKGNAIFITIEDETGIVNVLLWARLFERLRRPVMAARLMEVKGSIQRSPEGVVHLMATDVIDRTADLDALSETGSASPTLARADEGAQPPRGMAGRTLACSSTLDRSAPPRSGHPRDIRILPRSRDFH